MNKYLNNCAGGSSGKIQSNNDLNEFLESQSINI